VIPTIEDLDADVLATMNSLQCFRDKDKLLQELLNSKSVYLPIFASIVVVMFIGRARLKYNI